MTLHPIVYIIGSGQVNDLLEPLPLVSQPDWSIWDGVNTTSLGRRGQRPGQKSSSSQQPCVRDKGEPYSDCGFRLWSTYTARGGMGSVRLHSAQETP